MTREEAIKIIDCYDIGFYDLSGAKIPADKLADAFDMAIEALRTEGENGDGVVAYVCDNRKCGGDCDNCGRTTDIAHAKNFTRISDSYFERLDSVSVVRCKDCIHYEKHDTWSACTYWSGDPYEQASVIDDDFCSYGERQEP